MRAISGSRLADLGTLMYEIGRKAGLTDEDVNVLEKNIEEQRAGARHAPVRFE